MGNAWFSSDPASEAGHQWQPEQDEDEQPPHPELADEDVEAAPESDLPMPKRDMSFSVRFEPHFSHVTSGLEPKTNFSKSAPQALQ